MPTTINLPTNGQQSNTNNNTPVNSSPVTPPAPTSAMNDPWGAPSDSGWGWGGPSPMGGHAAANAPQKNLSPQERVEMIEKLYEEVLMRKADTRDVNYYKYSTLGEEEIRKQLITGKEHKQLLEDGREFKKMKDRATQAETRVRMLESQIKDQIQEFQNLTHLLEEKNKHIKQLREDLNNPYNFTNRKPQASEQPVNIPTSQPIAQPVAPVPNVNTQVFAQPVTSEPKSIKSDRMSIVDRIRNILP